MILLSYPAWSGMPCRAHNGFKFPILLLSLWSAGMTVIYHHSQLVMTVYAVPIPCATSFKLLSPCQLVFIVNLIQPSITQKEGTLSEDHIGLWACL